MKYIISESQLNVLMEQYDPDQLYPRDSVVRRLMRKVDGKFVYPKYIRDYAKDLSRIEKDGVIYTTIPEVLYVRFQGMG
jgi:hypothetical protein